MLKETPHQIESSKESLLKLSEPTQKQLTTQNNQSKQIRISRISKKRPYKIIKKIQDVQLKLKRGKDTPGIHIRALKLYMKDFKHHYEYEKNNFLEKAQIQLNRIIQKDKNLKASTLWEVFGGYIPADDAPQEQKEKFMIKRMNARVLQCIYQKHLMQIVFGSPRIQDKVTALMFIQQYRARLHNPLLCGSISTPRPKLPQKKYYPNRTESQSDSDSG